MPKIIAEVTAYSSVVGQGMLLRDAQTGFIFGRLLLTGIGNGELFSQEEHKHKSQEMCDRIAAAINAGQPEGQVRHYKREEPYDVVTEHALFQTSIDGGNARVIVDGEPLVVYRNPEGKHFVRVPDEVIEPRFTKVQL